jgi:hypothetical protein
MPSLPPLSSHQSCVPSCPRKICAPASFHYPVGIILVTVKSQYLDRKRTRQSLSGGGVSSRCLPMRMYQEGGCLPGAPCEKEGGTTGADRIAARPAPRYRYAIPIPMSAAMRGAGQPPGARSRRRPFTTGSPGFKARGNHAAKKARRRHERPQAELGAAAGRRPDGRAEGGDAAAEGRRSGASASLMAGPNSVRR